MRNKLIWASAMVLCVLDAGIAGAATPDQYIETAVGSRTAVDVADTSGTPAEAHSFAIQEPATDDEDGWQFAVTPYLWAPKISAEIEPIEGGTVDMDTSFSDILSNLKFAFMGTFEGRNGRFVMIGDIIYLHVGSEADGPTGFVETDVDLSTFIGTAVAGYRVVDDGPLSLDLFAGGRLTSIDAEIDLSGPLQSVEHAQSETQVSPVVGARFRAPLGKRWGLGFYGDLAGFGITSNLTWQLMGTVHYNVSDHWQLSAGYRHVAADTDKGNFNIDLALSGPIVGFSYRF